MSQDDLKEMTGSCLCGAVTLTGKPNVHDIGICHCNLCRKWSGGPLLAVDCTDVHIEGEGEVGLYKSSDWAERGFCKTCGTSLFWRLRDGSHYVVSAELFDDLSSHKLGHQIFVDEQPVYYAFANDTKKMTGAEVFAMFKDASKEH